MGRLLAHRGDQIDKAGVGDGVYQFIKRDGSRVGAQGIHRLFYGHDPFSLGADNPFRVLTKQYGLIRGIIQVLRHLLADTFSRQGLPIPFHSFLDYDKNGSVENWLGTWASQLKGASGLNPMEAFGHVGTIRTQDFVSQGLTWSLCRAYIHLADITDKTRACQVRLVAYGTHFLSHVLINQLRYGIPGINYPVLAMTIKEFAQFMWLNYADIRELEENTRLLVSRNIQLENEVFSEGQLLVSHDSAGGYLQELERAGNTFNRMTEVFEEAD